MTKYAESPREHAARLREAMFVKAHYLIHEKLPEAYSIYISQIL